MVMKLTATARLRLPSRSKLQGDAKIMTPLRTVGDLTQNFPAFSNSILNLSFYTNADPS